MVLTVHACTHEVTGKIYNLKKKEKEANMRYFGQHYLKKKITHSL